MACYPSASTYRKARDLALDPKRLRFGARAFFTSTQGKIDAFIDTQVRAANLRYQQDPNPIHEGYINTLLKVRSWMSIESQYPGMRKLTKLNEHINDDVREATAILADGLSRGATSAAWRRDFWFAAESGKPGADPAQRKMLAHFRSWTERFADVMVESGILEKNDLIPNYVMRMTDKTKKRTAVARVLEKELAGQMSRNKNYRSGGLEGMAEAVEKAISDRTRERRKLTSEEAEAEGYLVGFAPILETMRSEGPIYATLKTMQQAAKDPELAHLIREQEKSGPTDLEWRLADGPGWGVLNGKEIHHSIYDRLDMFVSPPERSGIMDWMSSLSEGERESHTINRMPGYQVKNFGLENMLNTWAAGVPLHELPFLLKDSIKEIVRYAESGEMSDGMRQMIRAGLKDFGARHLDSLTDAGIENMGLGDFRHLDKEGIEYVKQFWEHGKRNTGERMDRAREKGGGFHTVAELTRSLRDFTSGFDFVQAAGKDVHASGMKISASGQGLRAATSIVDLGFKLALYNRLTQKGSVGPLRETLGAEGKKYTPEEAMEIVKDWFDPRRVNRVIKGMSGMPLAFAYIKFPYKVGNNLVFKGDIFQNPLAGFTLLQAGMVGQYAFSKLTGLSEEEVSELTLDAAGGDERRQAQMFPLALSRTEDGQPMVHFADMTPVSIAPFAEETFWPPSRVSPHMLDQKYLGIPVGQGIRGLAAGDPLGSALYEKVTGRNAQTGGTAFQGSVGEKLLHLASWAGIPGAATGAQQVRKVVTNKRLREKGRANPETPGLAAAQGLTGIRYARTYGEGDPRGAEQKMKRQRREVDAFIQESGLSPRVVPGFPDRTQMGDDEFAEALAKFLEIRFMQGR